MSRLHWGISKLLQRTRNESLERRGHGRYAEMVKTKKLPRKRETREVIERKALLRRAAIKHGIYGPAI